MVAHLVAAWRSRERACQLSRGKAPIGGCTLYLHMHFFRALPPYLKKATFDSLLWGGYYYEVFQYHSRNELSFSSLKLKQLLCFWDGITLVSETCYRSDTFDLWNALWVVSKGNFLYSFVEVVFTCAVAGSVGQMLKHFCTVLNGKRNSVLWCVGYSRVVEVVAKLPLLWSLYLAGRYCAVANKS